MIKLLLWTSLFMILNVNNCISQIENIYGIKCDLNKEKLKIFHEMANWYIVRHFNKHKKARLGDSKVEVGENNPRFIDIPMLSINREKLEKINCDYFNPKFYFTLAIDTTNSFTSFVTYNSESWHIIQFSLGNFRFYKDKLPTYYSYGGIEYGLNKDLIEKLGKHIFSIQGYFCIFKGDKIFAYTGNNKFEDIRTVLSSGRTLDATLKYLCYD